MLDDRKKNNLSTTLRFLNLIFPLHSGKNTIIPCLSRRIKVQKKFFFKKQSQDREMMEKLLAPPCPSFFLPHHLLEGASHSQPLQCQTQPWEIWFSPGFWFHVRFFTALILILFPCTVTPVSYTCACYTVPVLCACYTCVCYTCTCNTHRCYACLRHTIPGSCACYTCTWYTCAYLLFHSPAPSLLEQ